MSTRATVANLAMPLALVVAGFALGATGAVVQAASTQVAGRSVPWGIVLTAALVGLFTRASCWLRGRRADGAALGVGWLVATLWLSNTGPGGDVLLTGSAATMVYVVASAVLILVALSVVLPATDAPVSSVAPAIDR